MVKVRILVKAWSGSIGILEDKIPNSDWWNVRVSPHLRLTLTEKEFSVYGATNYKVDEKDYSYSE